MYKTLATCVAFALLPLGANAAVIDLTDPVSYDIEQSPSLASGTIFGGSVTWEITGDPDDSLKYTKYDGPAGATGGGAEIIDGIGVADDEISAIPPELVHLSFSDTVTIDTLYFLDLFKDPRTQEQETVLVWFDGFTDGDSDATADLMITGTYMFPNAGGFHEESISFTGTKLTFGVLSFENDGQGVPDYALAGIGVAPIPLPASALLLLAGIGGLGAMRRFRKA